MNETLRRASRDHDRTKPPGPRTAPDAAPHEHPAPARPTRAGRPATHKPGAGHHATQGPGPRAGAIPAAPCAVHAILVVPHPVGRTPAVPCVVANP